MTTSTNARLRPEPSAWLAGFDTHADIADQRLDGMAAPERAAYVAGHREGWDARAWHRTVPPRLLAAWYDARHVAAKLLHSAATRLDTLPDLS
jgi:hypothetical protein